MGKKISHHKSDQSAGYLILCDEPRDVQLQPLRLDSPSDGLLSGFCVGGIPLQILPCSFQLCAQGAHYSCLPLYSSPTSVISHVISRCHPLLPLAVQWLHFSRLVFKGVFFFSPPDFFFFSYLCHFLIFLTCRTISIFRPFLACQRASVRLTPSLHCPQEGFLTASCEPHISNWQS